MSGYISVRIILHVNANEKYTHSYLRVNQTENVFSAHSQAEMGIMRYIRQQNDFLLKKS